MTHVMIADQVSIGNLNTTPNMKRRALSRVRNLFPGGRPATGHSVKIAPGFMSRRRHKASWERTHRLVRFGLALATCAGLTLPGPAQADVYVWASQSAGNTTFHYTGLIDTRGLGPPTNERIADALTSSDNRSSTLLLIGPDPSRPRFAPVVSRFLMTAAPPPFGGDRRGFNLPTTHTGSNFGWSGTSLIVPLGFTSGSISGSGTYPLPLSTLVGGNAMAFAMSFSHDIGNGTFIHMFMMPPADEDMDAINQVMTSALPTNQALGGIASGLPNAGTRDFSNRLFGVRSRYVPPGGGSTASNDLSANRGRSIAASRYHRMETRLNGSNTISLNGASRTSSTSASGQLGTPVINDNQPFLSVERSAGTYLAPGTIAAGKNWSVFASADFGKVELDDLGPTTPGVQSNTQVSNIGFEYAVSDNLSIGAGWSHLWNDNTVNGGLGSVDVEGNAAVIYATYFKDNFWGDFLYSYGEYESDVRRNTGVGTVVNGTPDIETHQAAFNIGYNMGHDGGRIVHGPTFGVSYTEGTVGGYTETGDPANNTAFASQDFESFITRLGYQVNWKVESTIGQMRPQVRIGYGRENLNRDQTVAAALVPNVANNNTVFGIGQSSADPGEGWLELGAGISIDLCENAALLIDYDGQFLRQDSQAHFGSVKVQMKF